MVVTWLGKCLNDYKSRKNKKRIPETLIKFYQTKLSALYDLTVGCVPIAA